jgi:hypothetical protein
LANGLDGEAGPWSAGFAVIDFEAGYLFDSPPAHRQAIFGRGNLALGLVGRLSAGDEQHHFRTHRLGSGPSAQQMSMMDGVKTPPQAYFVPHWQNRRLILADEVNHFGRNQPLRRLPAQVIIMSTPSRDIHYNWNIRLGQSVKVFRSDGDMAETYRA